MNNILLSAKRHYISFALFAIFFISIVFNIEAYIYIEEIDSQLEKRDSIINSLTFSDQLVKDYFDIQYDSIKNTTSYSLKKDKKSIVVHNTNTITEKIKETTITKTISNSSNNTLVNEYNSLARKYNKLVDMTNTKEDSLSEIKLALKLIKNSYGISYTSTRANDKLYVTLKAEKADSAFMLLPHYRDRLTYDKSKKAWIVVKERNSYRK